MKFWNHAAPFALVAAVLVLATSADADVREELARLRTGAEALLAGEGLDATQRKNLEKIVAAVEKAEAVPADADTKLLKKLKGVAKKVEKALAADVDLTTSLDEVIAAAAIQVEGLRLTGEGQLDLLTDARNRAKGRKLLDKAIGPQEQAGGEIPASQKAKLLAKSAKLFDKAKRVLEKLVRKEIDAGLIQLDIVATTFDDLPTGTGGAPILPAGLPVALGFNHFVDPQALPGDVVQLFSGGSPAGAGLDLAPHVDIHGNPAILINFIEPLAPGTYTLRVLGADEAGDGGVRSPEGIRLETTREFDFIIE